MRASRSLKYGRLNRTLRATWSIHRMTWDYAGMYRTGTCSDNDPSTTTNGHNALRLRTRSSTPEFQHELGCYTCKPRLRRTWIISVVMAIRTLYRSALWTDSDTGAANLWYVDFVSLISWAIRAVGCTAAVTSGFDAAAPALRASHWLQTRHYGRHT
ncbi:hypothetical protein BDZ89DRAFT_320117 [Hymenopellis radicata]|nr:hypothetical protein BDZ89DRAFT_320117 [Hymenopellis radicata]